MISLSVQFYWPYCTCRALRLRVCAIARRLWLKERTHPLVRDLTQHVQGRHKFDLHQRQSHYTLGSHIFYGSHFDKRRTCCPSSTNMLGNFFSCTAHQQPTALDGYHSRHGQSFFHKDPLVQGGRAVQAKGGWNSRLMWQVRSRFDSGGYVYLVSSNPHCKIESHFATRSMAWIHASYPSPFRC